MTDDAPAYVAEIAENLAGRVLELATRLDNETWLIQFQLDQRIQPPLRLHLGPVPPGADLIIDIEPGLRDSDAATPCSLEVSDLQHEAKVDIRFHRRAHVAVPVSQGTIALTAAGETDIDIGDGTSCRVELHNGGPFNLAASEQAYIDIVVDDGTDVTLKGATDTVQILGDCMVRTATAKDMITSLQLCRDKHTIYVPNGHLFARVLEAADAIPTTSELTLDRDENKEKPINVHSPVVRRISFASTSRLVISSEEVKSDWLKPGGVLVVTDPYQLPADTSPFPIVRRLMAAYHKVYAGHGADLHWARSLPSVLAGAGLTEIDYTGTLGCMGNLDRDRWRPLITQVAPAMVADGLLSADDIDEFLTSLDDPAFIDIPQFTITAWGRARPV